MKKYELTKETVTISGKTLYRIRAVRDFGSVKTGDLGGYIEKEENLSHFDDAWVSGNGKVSGNAKVFDNAEVFGNAWVFDNAEVSGNGKVSGNANVFDNARISGNAEIFNTRHFCTQGPIGSRNGFVTFYRTKDNTVEVKCGCFLGSLQEFVNQVEKTHKGNKYEKEYKLAAELAKVCIRLEGESK